MVVKFAEFAVTKRNTNYNQLQMKYKQIKKLVPYCEICNSEIKGNGSVISPYECQCGKYEWNEEKRDYILTKTK